MNRLDHLALRLLWSAGGLRRAERQVELELCVPAKGKGNSATRGGPCLTRVASLPGLCGDLIESTKVPSPAKATALKTQAAAAGDTPLVEGLDAYLKAS